MLDDGYDIRLVKQAGVYGGLRGVLGDASKPLNAGFGVWEANRSGEVLATGLLNNNPGEVRKLCRYNLEFVNLGNLPWSVNVFEHPDMFIMPPGGPRRYVYVVNLWQAQLLDSLGNDLASPADDDILGMGIMSWGGAPLAGSPKQWTWLEVGVNPGAAATTIEPLYGQFMDLTGVPNGSDYTFHLELDPLDHFGFSRQDVSIDVPVQLEALDLRRR